jgi:hypothetical protein
VDTIGDEGLTDANLRLLASRNPVHVGMPRLRSTSNTIDRLIPSNLKKQSRSSPPLSSMHESIGCIDATTTADQY